MYLKNAEIVAIIRFRLEDYLTRSMSLKAEDRGTAPEVAQLLLEAAQALVAAVKK